MYSRDAENTLAVQRRLWCHFATSKAVLEEFSISRHHWLFCAKVPSLSIVCYEVLRCMFGSFYLQGAPKRKDFCTDNVPKLLCDMFNDASRKHTHTHTHTGTHNARTHTHTQTHHTHTHTHSTPTKAHTANTKHAPNTRIHTTHANLCTFTPWASTNTHFPIQSRQCQFNWAIFQRISHKESAVWTLSRPVIGLKSHGFRLHTNHPNGPISVDTFPRLFMASMDLARSMHWYFPCSTRPDPSTCSRCALDPPSGGTSTVKPNRVTHTSPNTLRIRLGKGAKPRQINRHTGSGPCKNQHVTWFCGLSLSPSPLSSRYTHTHTLSLSSLSLFPCPFLPFSICLSLISLFLSLHIYPSVHTI